MGDYCSFTKAVEHLGDRWSLVIVRELLVHGTRSYSDLLEGASGISRSVLAARLRKLRTLGLLEQVHHEGGPARYRLTHAGRELAPVLQELRGWSERFVPEDPAMAEEDPDVVPLWLSRRLEPRRAPSRPAVLEVSVQGGRRERFWIVVERGAEPSVCIEDPGLSDERYVYLEAAFGDLLPLARGLRDWHAAVDDGSVRLFGDPGLVTRLPGWFSPPS